MAGQAKQQPRIGKLGLDFLHSYQVTREIEIDFNDWNFSRNINIGATPPSTVIFFFSTEECRVLFSRDLSYFLKISPGIRKKPKPSLCTIPSPDYREKLRRNQSRGTFSPVAWLPGAALSASSHCAALRGCLGMRAFQLTHR